MPPKKKRNIPPSVVKQLSRELAGFGPDLAIKPSALTLTPTDELGFFGEKPRGRTKKQAGARTLMSLYAGPQAEPGWWDRKRDALLKRAADLRNKYRDNPYITVKGFSIGLPLTLTIDFEFKD